MDSDKIKNIRKLLFVLIVFLSVSTHYTAAETLHVGVSENPPYVIIRDGEVSGITVDIINHTAMLKNIDIEYHFNTYAANLDLLSIGLIDILPAIRSESSVNSEYPFLISLKNKNPDFSSDISSVKKIIPCILVNENSAASFLADNMNFSPIIPLSEDIYNNDFYFSLLSKYGDHISPELNKKWEIIFLILFLVLIFLIIILVHLPVFKSVNKTGREIISEVESPDLYSFIYKKIYDLLNPDYFCIGNFENSYLYLYLYSNRNPEHLRIITEKIDNNSSCFIYALKNKKNTYIKNCSSDFLKYINSSCSLKEIDSRLNSAFIIPLILNSRDIIGAAAVLDNRKNAFSFFKRYLMTGISKYITISLKNKMLINKNRELLDCIERDKNKILKAKQEVEYLAQHDPLTDLPNRLYLTEFLNQSIKKSNRTGKRLAVIFIDMDNFKEANDIYGHQTGDNVLITAAKRFKNLLRESDIVIRFGGDEFIIILEDINSADDVKQVANKIISTCTAPVLTDTADLSLSFSIGISMYPDNGSSADELIRKADIALYKVKNNIKGTWKFYNEPV